VGPVDLEEKIAAADAGAALDPEPAGAPSGDAALPAPGDDSLLWINAAVRYGAIARAMLPEHVRPHWTEERLHAVGVELAACARHYGWQWGGIVNHPLAKLAAVSFPLAWPLLEPYVMPYIKSLSEPKLAGTGDASSSAVLAEEARPAPQGPKLAPVG
jgi:hypothetical protein